jgi:hypothetical protein
MVNCEGKRSPIISLNLHPDERNSTYFINMAYNGSGFNGWQTIGTKKIVTYLLNIYNICLLQ